MLLDALGHPRHRDRPAQNARDIGTLGAGFKGKAGYEPPHSQGPGEKRYTIHLYALSAAPPLPAARNVTRDTLLAAIKTSCSTVRT